MTNALSLAMLTLEVWRASGARTERRRELLLMTYAETYFGVHLRWTDEQRATVDAARLLTRQRTRIDELTYELPGTDVRATDTPTPTFDAPFSLKREASTATREQQTDLFSRGDK